MHVTRFIGFALILTTSCVAVKAQTSSNPELGQVRQEMQQLKQDYEQMSQAYEARLKQLDERLKQLETANPQPALVSAAFVSTRPAPTATHHAATAASSIPSQTQSESQAPSSPASFQEPTDSVQLSVAQQKANPVAERMENVLHNYVDITGYFRAGYGRDDEGGPQVGFQAPGAMAKGRLGNEAENYGELAFSKSFYLPGAFSLTRNSAGGPSSAPVGQFLVRVSMFNPYQNYNVSGDTTFGIAEAWGAIGNISARQPSMNVWAGNRFYRRHDTNINDFMLYNMSGGGAGVEDIKIPFGKFAVAWIGFGSQSGFSDLPQPDPANKAGFNKTNFDFRLYDMMFLGGKGEFGFDVSKTSAGNDALGVSAPGATGVSFSFVHTAEKWANEHNMNKFFIQYGRGPAKTFTSGFETYTTSAGSFIRPDASDSYRFRVADNMVLEAGNHFTVSPVILYQFTDYKQFGGQQHWFSAGARPQAHFNDYVSLAFEPFVDWTDDKNTGISDYLFKFTFAPQVSLGRHFASRPAIRGFVTYAQWGNGFKGQIGGPDYINSTQGVTWGAQMESWW
jgi:maltoporin